ncbi:hypothetical protein [Mycobacterium szulgai]|uniref:hypothetical protein n=1 Tax=Mycobacterium szulgai TaxID=1787 RepID=UPI001FE2E391|nr:hypothetical protein [Mycobacterium szulgai]
MPATLSQILAWSTEHLIDAAGYWTKTADQWEDAFFQMRNQSYAVDWSGAGGDALGERTSADLLIVSAKADMLREAAGIARNGSGDISAAQRRVLYGVEDAHNAGSTVGEDLSVTDTHTSSTPAEQAARQAQAQAFAGDIRLRAQQLDEADAKVAGQLTAATADLGSVDFAQSPIPNPVAQAPATHRKGVQLVDFKQDGGISPPPPFAPLDTPDGTPPPPQPPFIPQYEQALTAPRAPATPGPPMPSYVGHPPGMTRLPPGPPFDPAQSVGSAEKNPEMGPLIAGAAGGCAGGAGIAAAIVSPFPPAEVVAPETGCIAGAATAASTYLGGIWLENLLNGNG